MAAEQTIEIYLVSHESTGWQYSAVLRYRQGLSPGSQWKATKELTQHGVRSDERRDDIGRTIRIESESQLESDPDTGRETVINGRKTVGSD